MSSPDSSTGQQHGGISGGALAVAIALPIIFGVALLLAIPFLIARYKRRKSQKMESVERSMGGRGFGHQRTMSDISETNKPLLLMESPPRQSFARLPSLSPDPRGETTFGFTDRPATPGSLVQLPNFALNLPPLPSDRQRSQEKLADLANVPMPTLSPPPPAKKSPQPILLSIPSAPERPVSKVSKPVDITASTDLLHRPSFLTKPRAAPPVPGMSRAGPSRHGRPDMRGALLTRMATKRSRSQGDSEDSSPVSIYSQASLRRGDTHKFFPKRKGGVDGDVPPVPAIPQPFSSDCPTDQGRRYSFSGMPSPSRHIFQPSPIEGETADNDPPSPSLLRHPFFQDDMALPSPEASLVSNSRWWSNVWGSYIPSSPTNPSPTQASTGGLGFPVGRRSLNFNQGNRLSVHNAKTKDAPWFHAMPEYGVVEEGYGRADEQRGQVMVAAWSARTGSVERAARKLPAAPEMPVPSTSSSASLR